MTMILRSLSLVVACAVSACTTPVHAAGIFWLSNSNVAGAPAPMAINGAPGSTGTMYLWGQSDVGVAGFGFNVASSGPALTFTSATYSADASNPAFWNLGNKPIAVAPAKVSDITAATLASGGGFGPGTTVGNTMLIAALNYTAGPVEGASNLSIQVNDFGVADNQGNPLSFRIGSPNAPLITGDQFDVSGAAGTFSSFDSGTLVVNLIDIGERDRSADNIVQQLSSNFAPSIWSDLTQTKGPPVAIPPTLATDGTFTWNPAGSKVGKSGSGQVVYEWSAIATFGILGSTPLSPAFRVTLVPEPATMSLIGLAMIGAMRVIRRRGESLGQ